MWECAIGDCEYRDDDAENLLVHQAMKHEKHQCEVCGTTMPDGYFAIQHMFAEHTRAEYLRNYEASTEDIRLREAVRDKIEATTNIEAAVRRIKEEL